MRARAARGSGTLMGAAALVGFLLTSAFSADAATGSGRGSVASRVLATAPSPLIGLSVDGGAAFYHDFRRVTRIGLRDGRSSTLYPGAPATKVTRIAAGGGRVAIGTERKVVPSPSEPSLASSVLVPSSAGGRPTEIVVADFRVQATPAGQAVCGDVAALKDVTPSGEVLVERRTQPCDGGAPSLVYERYGPGGPVGPPPRESGRARTLVTTASQPGADRRSRPFHSRRWAQGTPRG